MCGIIGYVGSRQACPILLEGLKRLEYRGYDSAGVAVLDEDGELAISKTVGKLDALASTLASQVPQGTMGVGHTRWATHGRPTVANAHPHLDCGRGVVVVHNGIVENHAALREELKAQGHTFRSQTDTEVIPHLIEGYLAQGCSLEEAVRRAVERTEGAHAIVVMSKAHPSQMVAARVGNAGGVVVGYGEGEMFLASDLPALLPCTRRVAFLASRELALVTARGATYCNSRGQAVHKALHTIPYDPVAAAKGTYKHFMLKEIMEQPEALMDTIRGRLTFEPHDVYLEDFSLSPEDIRALRRVVIVACGTSLHAGLVGRFMIEELAQLPVEVDYGSEFRYRDPWLDRGTLLVAITQSGETADTLAAMEAARGRGIKQVAICNVVGSEATRIADALIYTRSGPEVAVASTKAFTGQLAALYLLAAHMGRERGVVDSERMKSLTTDLAHLPYLMGQVMETDRQCQRLAHQLFRPSHFLYLGRGINYPIALEGALKLKEVSYIHAEGYPAGEMKHGPISLIDESMPVVAIALRDRVYEKMVNNIEEVKAREGTVIALATEGDALLKEKADHVIYIPPSPYLLEPVLAVMPLQLLAYHIGVRRGCDVDQPRNLAKSVTVE